jgi:CBS domain-containing protein
VTDGRHASGGIFTGRNVVHRARRSKSAVRVTLTEVMTSNPDTMLPGKIAIEALRLMEDGRYRYLPIVDDGKVVGTVSRFDFGGFELDEENPLVRERI